MGGRQKLPFFRDDLKLTPALIHVLKFPFCLRSVTKLLFFFKKKNLSHLISTKQMKNIAEKAASWSIYAFFFLPHISENFIFF